MSEHVNLDLSDLFRRADNAAKDCPANDPRGPANRSAGDEGTQGRRGLVFIEDDVRGDPRRAAHQNGAPNRPPTVIGKGMGDPAARKPSEREGEHQCRSRYGQIAEIPVHRGHQHSHANPLAKPVFAEHDAGIAAEQIGDLNP